MPCQPLPTHPLVSSWPGPSRLLPALVTPFPSPINPPSSPPASTSRTAMDRHSSVSSSLGHSTAFFSAGGSRGPLWRPLLVLFPPLHRLLCILFWPLISLLVLLTFKMRLPPPWSCSFLSSPSSQESFLPRDLPFLFLHPAIHLPRGGQMESL